MKGHQPVYVTCEGSKRLVALTLLALATKDDELGEDCMDHAVCDYVGSMGYGVSAGSVMAYQSYDHRGQIITSMMVQGQAGSINKWRMSSNG